MAFEQYPAHEWKSISATPPPPPAATAAGGESETVSGGFDCSICLDFACDPVVTLCGHLYCWPCIYKWCHFQSDSLASNEHPQCPVCKAEISHTAVVPLYGRGHSPKQPELEGKAIPPRPPACGTKSLSNYLSHPGQQQQLLNRNPYQDQQHFEEEMIFNSSPGMFGEMVYSRVFGNSESLYEYPNSYHLTGSTSPRLRRQEMQAEMSLNRVTIFLFCCFLLCLALF